MRNKGKEGVVLTPEKGPAAVGGQNEKKLMDAIRSSSLSLSPSLRYCLFRLISSREKREIINQPTFALGVLLPSRAARMAARLVRLVLLAVARDAAHPESFVFSVACLFTSLKVRGDSCDLYLSLCARENKRRKAEERRGACSLGRGLKAIDY